MELGDGENYSTDTCERTHTYSYTYRTKRSYILQLKLKRNPHTCLSVCLPIYTDLLYIAIATYTAANPCLDR